MTLEQARENADMAVLRLWLAMRALSDFGGDALTEDDLDVWGKATSHRAVQRRLQACAGEVEKDG